MLGATDQEAGAHGTRAISLRLAAVRRVAYEAADAGLLSPELAAGIRRVKGVRRLGVRLGNWLSRRRLRHARDHAMLAMLIGCGLRRGELLGPKVLWDVVRAAARRASIENLAPHDPGGSQGTRQPCRSASVG